MNQIINKITTHVSKKNIISAYCIRNNINENQFKKAISWYLTAKNNSNKIDKSTSNLKKNK